jgi:hypothetical protein
MTDPLLYAAAALVGVVGVARLTRLLTSDAYPPSVWVRTTWANLVRHGQWEPLVTCPFCASPYIAAASLAWVLTAGVRPDGFWSQAWWIFWGWLATSYVAAMIVVRDEPPEE